MQPLGLNGAGVAAYHDLLRGSHDFAVEVDVLNMEEKLLGSLSPQMVDGQVNIQRDAAVARTATFTFYDPDRSLHLDTDSPFAGALFADRMIRARHVVRVPGHGVVRATPFVGPIVKVSREGENLTVECQDKTLLAVEGCRPLTVRKGMNAVDAILRIMRVCTGERRFRFPRGHKVRLKQSYNVGWKPEASPWAVCQKIARSINMQLVYSGDGALVLRRRPNEVALTIAAGGMLTGPIRAEYDVLSVRNYVRVTGEKKRQVGTKAKPKTRTVEFTEDGIAKRGHPFSPGRLGRNGSPRFLPLLVDDSSIKKESAARRMARDLLQQNLSMGVTASFSAMPLFHLDYGDIVLVKTEYGDARIPFTSASIPLGLGGDASYGRQAQVSRPRRRA